MPTPGHAGQACVCRRLPLLRPPKAGGGLEALLATMIRQQAFDRRPFCDLRWYAYTVVTAMATNRIQFPGQLSPAPVYCSSYGRAKMLKLPWNSARWPAMFLPPRCCRARSTGHVIGRPAKAPISCRSCSSSSTLTAGDHLAAQQSYSDHLRSLPIYLPSAKPRQESPH